MLTDRACKAAKPEAKERKLTDGRGLFLLVKPTGYKSWRWKYRFNGKEKLLTIGSYPHVSLAEAREARDEALKQKRAGVDPGLARRQAKAIRLTASANTFEAVARSWHTRRIPTWSKSTSRLGAWTRQLPPFAKLSGGPRARWSPPWPA